MDSENWYKMDNVAKVFLATHTNRDTRSLRVSVNLDEDVDAECLQKALDKAILSRPLFQTRIRRGFFWHYLEPTDYAPKVVEEEGRPCPVLYGRNFKGVLHYKVSYYHNRINLELFHALSDGTGALEFLNVIVENYLRIKHPEEMKNVSLGNGGTVEELTEDSFDKFYENKAKGGAAAKYSYHIRGRKLPFEQLQFFKVTMNSKQVIALAKEMGVGVSGYIGASIMMAMYNDMPSTKRKKPITISMPVNLRNYYPSATSRNFFNSINVSHVFSGEETLQELAKEFEVKMKASLDKESIKRRMDNYQKLEKLLFVRMVPLMFKQPVVKYVSKAEARKVSAVISNLGVMKVPDSLSSYIRGYEAFCSHNELFITILSFGENMTFGITSGYRSTTVIKDFIRGFSSKGVDVRVDATEVVR